MVEIKRILKPGGIFLFGEIELACFGADGRSSGEMAPGVNALYSYFKRAVEAQGISVNGTRDIDSWIEAAGGFQKPVHQTVLYPIGGHWLSPKESTAKEVGRLMLQNVQRLGASMKPVLLHYGVGQPQVDALVDSHQRDLVNPNVRLYHKYHMVYAIRQ